MRSTSPAIAHVLRHRHTFTPETHSSELSSPHYPLYSSTATVTNSLSQRGRLPSVLLTILNHGRAVLARSFETVAHFPHPISLHTSHFPTVGLRDAHLHVTLHPSHTLAQQSHAMTIPIILEAPSPVLTLNATETINKRSFQSERWFCWRPGTTLQCWVSCKQNPNKSGDETRNVKSQIRSRQPAALMSSD